MKKAIFPGSFNPIHNGHVEVIKEAAKNFDKLFVVVGNNETKKYKTLVSERFNIVDKCVKDLNIENVETIKLEGKLMPILAKEMNVEYIVRGIRGEKLLEYEADMADNYLDFNDALIFNYISIEGNNLSSTIIRERVKKYQPISELVPKSVEKEITLLYEKN